mmetsp:Transcript_3381/g.1991  ORF Transcript_3381/g.1991 Transcript_3381/m.1991 type:complete len:101 (+) Transcript_3381:356-658(+)
MYTAVTSVVLTGYCHYEEILVCLDDKVITLHQGTSSKWVKKVAYDKKMNEYREWVKNKILSGRKKKHTLPKGKVEKVLDDIRKNKKQPHKSEIKDATITE